RHARELGAERLHPLALEQPIPDVIGAEELLALPARLHRVVEAPDVTRRLPDPRMADDRAVEADDLELVPVRAGRRGPPHRHPPQAAEFVFNLDAEGPVVQNPVQPAIDLGRLEDEAAALAEGDQLLHQRRTGRGWHRGVYLSRRAGMTKAL